MNNSGSSTVPYSGVLNLPLVVVSARSMSITGTAAITARAMSGHWVSTAPISNPPLEPPTIASRSRLVIPLR